MAIDLKLNDTHDLAIEDGDLVLLQDEYEVIQSAKIRLLFIKGEWWLDLLMGVPWFDEMFRIVYSLRQKQDVLKNTILETEGVRRITKFDFGVDLINQGSLVEFAVETDFGPVTGEITQ